MEGREHSPPVVLRRTVDEVAVGSDDVRAGAQEVAPPPVGVEADDVVGQQAVVERDANRLREDAPVVRLGPGDVHEMRQRGVRSARADEAGCEIEVVVVEEDGRLGLGVQLGDDRVGEAGVDRDVPLVPREMEAAVEIGYVSEIPEVVLQKPERRVRDDVVEPVVGGLVVSDEAEPIRRSVARSFLDRLAARLLRNRPILVGHRARHPGDVVQGNEAPQRCHEPAAAAAGNSVAVLIQAERDRGAIGDDDQFAARGHALTLPKAPRRTARLRPGCPKRSRAGSRPRRCPPAG